MSRPGPTSEQERAIHAAGSVAVTAGAGTGKTYMLTERYVHHVIEDGLGPLQIVAATFTDRAASELRSRIRARLRQQGVSSDRAAELEAAQIGTLHALAGRICREHPEAAGVPYAFTLLDGLDQTLFRERHVTEAFDDLPFGTTPGLSFQTLKAAVRALLDDPHTAERALAADPDDWPNWIDAERHRAREELVRSDAWRDAVATLREHEGPADDKMERQRGAALEAVTSLEEGHLEPWALATLDGLTARPGSKKVWGEDVLRDLKEACAALRDAFRSERDVLELRWTEADDRLAHAQTVVRDAYWLVRARLTEEKRRRRVLDFADLELHALQALRDPAVTAFYSERWQAFLIDEFQDTNPVQAEILAHLTAGSTLTIVGDEKQSIYGFRRADVDVFRDVRMRIEEEGGSAVQLATSFRTHRTLVERTNEIVRPALGELHEPLSAHRQDEPGVGPFVQVQMMEFEGHVPKAFRRRAEAYRVGAWIEDALIGDQAAVFDRTSGEYRPVTYGDIAILARSWHDLEAFGEELAARGIPTLHAGGGNLFEQREVTDGLSLLRFLTDPSDDLSLVAVLRAPWFGVSDVEIGAFAEDVRAAATSSWWAALAPRADVEAPPGTLDHAAAVFAELLDLSGTESPPRLLAEADTRTGYTAVVANLPGGPRRLADWRGFVDLVRSLAGEHAHLLDVVRQLDEIAGLEGSAVPRPAMEAGDAVALMTIHGAKGLEWPVVVLPDLAKREGGRGMEVGFEPGVGVAFKVWNAGGEEVEPAIYTLLKARERSREDAEEMRVLYVALTRARDRLFLTANREQGGKLDRISAGLESAGIEPEVWTYQPDHAVPRAPQLPSVDALGELRLGRAGPEFEHLDVTALSTWTVCPKRFDFDVRRGHPGAAPRKDILVATASRDAGSSAGAADPNGARADGEPEALVRLERASGRRIGAVVGSLAHVALERGIGTVEAMRSHEPRHDANVLRRALVLADVFRKHERFAAVRGTAIQKHEQYVSIELDGVTLHGFADAVGADFVLDYKTGHDDRDAAHDVQVAVYASALGVDRGYVAYLRTDDDGGPDLVAFGPDELAAALERARAAVKGIRAGDYAATPGRERCAACPFERVCEDSAWKP